MEESRYYRAEELIVVFNHNVKNLYFTSNKSTMYTSYMIKYTSFYDRVFTCLHNSSVRLICHFFLIPWDEELGKFYCTTNLNFNSFSKDPMMHFFYILQTKSTKIILISPSTL